MLSIAPITANTNNARRSCGPRTVEGLARSSRNAVRHGLAATAVVVIDGVEDPAEYLLLRDATLDDLDVRGPVETLLGERIAQLFWRLRRVLRFETERLSHAQRALMPYIADMDAMLRERGKREGRLKAISQLLLPSDHILASDVIQEILDACAAVLAEPERTIFWESMDRDHEGTSASALTVTALTAIMHRAEASLCASGATIANLPARAYEYFAGVHCAWAWTSRSADIGREQQRTDALLLELAQAGVVERYEPRLRRDLSRTLQDLLELQTRRGRQAYVADTISPNEPAGRMEAR